MSSKTVHITTYSLNIAYSTISRFLAELETFWNYVSDVKLDFSRCAFLSSEGAAIIASFKLYRDSRGFVTRLDPDTPPSPIWKQLGRWGILQLFGYNPYPWTDNAIPILHQTSLDPRALDVYTCSHIEPARGNMPQMTPRLTKKVRSEINELFSNVFEHSSSPCGGLAIGQFHPNKRTVQLCVCDVGVGLVKRVRESVCGLSCPKKAIAWALTKGNSTLNNPRIPRGLGLHLLHNFVRVNGGELRILANDGLYFKTGAADFYEVLGTPFPGTLLQISFNVRDGEAYALASELRG